jgi:hypothetical protein
MMAEKAPMIIPLTITNGESVSISTASAEIFYVAAKSAIGKADDSRLMNSPLI